MARRAMRNFSPLYIYRLYTIPVGAYLDVRASLFTFKSAVHFTVGIWMQGNAVTGGGERHGAEQWSLGRGLG